MMKKIGQVMVAALDELICYLDRCTAPADLDILQDILNRNTITREDLKAHCSFSDTRYTRNLVKSSDWYELLVLCWRSGQRSFIHDHYGSSCALKIIEGVATEIRCDCTGRHRESTPLVRPVSTHRYVAGEVCGSRSLDIHEVSNTEHSDLITIHIYSPPLAMRVYEWDEGAHAGSASGAPQSLRPS